MISEEERDRSKIEHLIQSGATITILFHLLLFFTSYNFSTEIIMLGTGWILLIPGFAILLLSVPNKVDNEQNLRPLFNYTKYPLQIGWAIISISFTLIAQSLISLTLTIVFISFLVLIVREDEIVSKA